MITYPPGTTVGQVNGEHYWDGTAWVLKTYGVLPLANGGTNGTDAASARAGIGAAAAADLTSHVGLKNVHGVTRELISFTPQTPPHISGNLVSHAVQRGQADWFDWSNSTVAMGQAGGADGGGCVRITVVTPSYGLTQIVSQWNAATVVPGTNYTESVRVRNLDSVSHTFQTDIYWYTSGGGSTGVTEGAVVTVPAGATCTIQVTGNASAERGRLVVRSGDTVWGTTPQYEVSVACLRTSPTIPASLGVTTTLGVPASSASVCARSDGAGGAILLASSSVEYLNWALPACPAGSSLSVTMAGATATNGALILLNLLSAINLDIGYGGLNKSVPATSYGVEISTTTPGTPPAVVYVVVGATALSPNQVVRLTPVLYKFESYS